MRNILFLIICAIPLSLLANGGPIDGSNFYRLGVVTLVNTPDVHLKKELLLIKLEGDYSNVTVFYTLQNTGNSQKIKYAFPVDFDRSMEAELDCNLSEELKNEREILAFAIYDGNNKLPITEKKDSEVTKETYQSGSENITLELYRKWFITELFFSANEKKEIMVSYFVKNNFLDWAYSKSCFVEYSNRLMSYDFTPAINWGGGKVDEIEVIVDASEILRNYATCDVKGLPGIVNREGKYIYKNENVDINNLGRLTITYDNSVQNRSREMTHDLLVSPKEFSIKASSTLGISDSVRFNLNMNYTVDKLTDNDFTTAWAEGAKGPGIGEYIEITFEKGFDVACIAAINGYSKNAETYYNNNRIKDLQIDYVGRDGKSINHNSTIVSFKDLPYSKINGENFAKMLSVIGDFGDGESFKKIRLTIKSVYPGKKFNDTCLSELLIWGYHRDE
jgi:hypothetical protein